MGKFLANISWQAAAASTLIPLMASSCIKKTEFMKQTQIQDGDAGLTVAVQTAVQDGVITASLKPSATETQLLKVEDDPAIAGTEVAFPPGSLAVDTELKITNGKTIADEDTLLALGIENEFTNVGPTVSITPEQAVDALKPFSLSIPLPNSATLTADVNTGSEALMRLVVVYIVEKASEGRSYTGLITNDSLIVENGMAKFDTMHFGQFQTAYVKEVITGPVEQEAPAEPEAPVSRYYVQGVSFTAFPQGSTLDETGNQGWLTTLAPARISKTDLTLTTGYRAYESRED